ncbi:hypothetical protein SBA4_3020017 [Candidatus Sulfopaludibacter sp. SbA4]|nr:hypothetical protein SBA4_3020017 [Candidatus Sulfopaludibacter sp. SbA4]
MSTGIPTVGRRDGLSGRYERLVALPCDSKYLRQGVALCVPPQNLVVLWGRRSVFVVCQPEGRFQRPAGHEKRWPAPRAALAIT